MPNKRMQSDQSARGARTLTADAKRYKAAQIRPMRPVFKLLAFFALLFSTNTWATCDNQDSLTTKPQSKETVACLYTIKSELGRGNTVDKDFVHQFLRTLLPQRPADRAHTSDLGYFDIRYTVIAEIISLLKSENLVEAYIDFIIFSKGSADEKRSFGLGKLYTLQAPLFIKALGTKTKEEQAIVIRSLSWGLVNNFHPHINEGNYRRLIVGEYWELVSETSAQELQTWIETVVLELLDAK